MFKTRYGLEPSNWWKHWQYKLESIKGYDYIVPVELNEEPSYPFLDPFGQICTGPVDKADAITELSNLKLDNGNKKNEIETWCSKYGLLGIFSFRTLLISDTQALVTDSWFQNGKLDCITGALKPFFPKTPHKNFKLYSKEFMNHYCEPLELFLEYAQNVRDITEISAGNEPFPESESDYRKWSFNRKGVVDEKFQSVLSTMHPLVSPSFLGKKVKWDMAWDVTSLYGAMFVAISTRLVSSKYEYNFCLECGKKYKKTRKTHQYCEIRCKNRAVTRAYRSTLLSS